MSNRLSRIKDKSDIVFKKAPHSIDVFIVIKADGMLEDVKYVTKDKVSSILRFQSKNIAVFDEDSSTVLAMNFLDNV